MKTTHILLATALSACLCSCMVDRDLDLNKEYEDKLNLVPGISAPIQAETRLFTIDGILDLALKGQEALNGVFPIGEFFTYDDAGNFCTPYGRQEFKATIFPSSSIGTVSGSGIPVNTVLTLEDGWSSKSFQIATNDPVSISPSNIGSSILRIRDIKIKPVGMNLKWFFFSQPFTKATVKAGSSITLPDWMKVSSTDAGISVGEDGHTLLFSQDMTFTDGSFTVPFTLESLVTPEEGFSCTNGYIDFSAGTLGTSIEISFDKTDTSLSDETECSFISGSTFNGETLDAAEADCLVSEVIPFGSGSFDVTPSMISLLSFAFKPSGLIIDVNVTNYMDGPVSLCGTFSAKDSDGQAIGAPVTVGSGAGAVAVEIGALQSRTVRFSGTQAPLAGVRIPIPEVNDALASETFSSAGLRDLGIGTGTQRWVHVDAGKEILLAKADVKALATVTMSSGLDTQADITIGHFGVDTTFALDSYSPAFIDLVVESTIPMGIDIRCCFVDKDGQEVTQYSPIVSSSIAPGTAFMPRESILTIGFQTDRIVPFESLRLQLLLDFGAYRTFTLNRDQGLTFKRIVIRAPEGVVLDPDWLEYIKYLNSILTLAEGVDRVFFN